MNRDRQTDLRASLNTKETMPESQSGAPDFGRRQALAQLALILTGLRSLSSLEDFSPEALLAEGAKLHRHVANPVTEKHVEDPRRLLFFNPHQFRTIDVICELIIPQTDTAGAHAAGVPQFVDFLLAERETQMQGGITAGLSWLDRRSRELFAKDFVDAASEQQIEFLTRVGSAGSLEATVGQVFFNQIKNLTVFGYYTSKVGLEELGYAGPQGLGTYEGSVPVAKP